VSFVFFFLLSINEVNLKTDFVNSKKIDFIDFLDELGLFLEENPIFEKKKNMVGLPSAVIS
jgi:hypothetical protein